MAPLSSGSKTTQRAGRLLTPAGRFKLSGSVHSVFDYFRPRGGNPYVLLFHAVIIFIYLLAVYWIYFGSGAEFLVNHPGLFNWSPKSTTGVKIIAAISLAGGFFGMYLMWSMQASGH
jgi:hypothetical protein